MEDFAAQILAEEADLVRKLAAVREFKAAYGIGAPPASLARAKPSVTAAKRVPRDVGDRVDKFGDYGQSVIDTALQHLPGEDGAPVRTRDLIPIIELFGPEIRGANKVNALSALLARSSKIKGYGRMGWTRFGPSSAPIHFSDLVGDGPNENEPHSGEAGGSYAGKDGVPAPTNPQINPFAIRTG